jgi:hypothetical protein
MIKMKRVHLMMTLTPKIPGLASAMLDLKLASMTKEHRSVFDLANVEVGGRITWNRLAELALPWFMGQYATAGPRYCWILAQQPAFSA